MNLKYTYPRVLTIAGSDSGGCAGIQADLKTFLALGCHGMTAVSALTAQNTQGVEKIMKVPASFLLAQLKAVYEDIGVDSLKIGMLSSRAMVRIIAKWLDEVKLPKVVLDPVMVATSGDVLVNEETRHATVKSLFPRSLVITPNIAEAEILLGSKIQSLEDMKVAATQLLSLGSQWVLLKGGHLHLEDQALDVLVSQGGEKLYLSSPMVDTINNHGTGCTLSAAVAAHLALGYDLKNAVKLAKKYIYQAIFNAKDVKLGHGHGPLNHGWAPKKLKKQVAS